MSAYLIIYDLVAPGQDYKTIHEQVKTYGKWARPTESTWIVVTDKSAVEIRDHIQRYIDSNDRLLVVKSGVEAAWRNTKCSNDWLQKNL